MVVVFEYLIFPKNDFYFSLLKKRANYLSTWEATFLNKLNFEIGF